MDDCIEEVKKALNNIIWMYAPKETTLEDAEDVSYRMFQIFNELKRNPKERCDE